MISDVLDEAAGKIRHYLGDPRFERTYTGKLREDLNRLLGEMERMRERLDAPPGEGEELFVAFRSPSGVHYMETYDRPPTSRKTGPPPDQAGEGPCKT